MRRSAPYFARFRDFLRFGRKEDAKVIAESSPEEVDGQESELEEYDALRARGVMKHVRPYEPPANLDLEMRRLVQEAVSDTAQKTTEQWTDVSFSGKDGNDVKFRLFTAAEKQFRKTVLNSHLHEIKTVRDLLEYYRTPVKSVTNYVEMSRARDKAPKNLHVIETARLFHPVLDGETAFPGRSRYVTDLRARQFDKGFRAKTQWHHYQETHFDYDETPPECPWSKPKAKRMDIQTGTKLPTF